MRILDAGQMREADRRTIDELGIPAAALMENAGRASVAALTEAYGALAQQSVALLCGRGNNGGDGFVIARLLAEQQAIVSVFIVGGRAGVRGDALEKLTALEPLGLPIYDVCEESDWETVREQVTGAALVVDAITGTGFTPPLRGVAATIADDVARRSTRIAAIDLPSGLSADSCDVIGPAVRAELTVALGAPKLPLLLEPASIHAGRVVVADIGIPQSVVDAVPGPWLAVTTREEARTLMPVRRANSHKGQYGHVVVVAGSSGKVGAGVLAARAALRAGAGLVTLATSASLLPLVGTSHPELMTCGLPEDTPGFVADNAAQAIIALRPDVLVVGPGLGTGFGVEASLAELLALPLPIVLDADALNVLARDPARLAARSAPTVLTPHPGEMARLTNSTTADVQAARIPLARQFAAEHRAHVVLKGHRTVIAAPDGRAWLNVTGNPGMATAGAGDVLAGIIAAWVAVLPEAADAARLGVFVHGAAGDLAASRVGQTALIASDIIANLGTAMLSLEPTAPEQLSW